AAYPAPPCATMRLPARAAAQQAGELVQVARTHDTRSPAPRECTLRLAELLNNVADHALAACWLTDDERSMKAQMRPSEHAPRIRDRRHEAATLRVLVAAEHGLGRLGQEVEPVPERRHSAVPLPKRVTVSSRAAAAARAGSRLMSSSRTSPWPIHLV